MTKEIGIYVGVWVLGIVSSFVGLRLYGWIRNWRATRRSAQQTQKMA